MPEKGASYYDRQEVRDAGEREAAIFGALPGLIRHAQDNAPHLAERLGSVDADAIVSRAALARLPLIRKAELIELQRRHPPFGRLTATPTGRLARLFASPGPIYDPEGARADYWRFARAMFAAGFRRGDILHNSFSYHLTPAGAMAESGARALGMPVIPGGTAQTELQVRTIADLGPTAYAGTPSFLLTLLDRARELRLDAGSLKKALVSGEAFPPSAQGRLAGEFGIDAYQCYATADLGLIAYETTAREGLVVDEAIILEIVGPDNGEPVAMGEVGEVVVTAFNPDYPLIRFATGDLSAELPGASPCGRTNRRIKGWLGRADQATKVRGMFVRPEQVREAVRAHDAVGRARLVVHAVDGRDQMRLVCEAAAGGGLEPGLAAALRAVTGLRAEVEIVAPGTLPDDGKLIDDQR